MSGYENYNRSGGVAFFFPALPANAVSLFVCVAAFALFCVLFLWGSLCYFLRFQLCLLRFPLLCFSLLYFCLLSCRWGSLLVFVSVLYFLFLVSLVGSLFSLLYLPFLPPSGRSRRAEIFAPRSQRVRLPQLGRRGPTFLFFCLIGPPVGSTLGGLRPCASWLAWWERGRWVFVHFVCDASVL